MAKRSSKSARTKSKVRRGYTRQGFRLNWQPDLPDQRDFLFSYVRKTPKALPTKIDLRERCSPIVNQGKIGSCTGNALSGALEYLERADLDDQDLNDPHVYEKNQFVAISRLFIYFNERVLEGTTDSDAGARIRDGIKSLEKWGACRETIWKYQPGLVFKTPTSAAFTDAKKHLISAYLSLQTLDEMRTCLAEGFPFVFGFSVYESFETLAVAKSGIMPMPEPSEHLLGGHAVMAVGYDDKKKMILVRNSWGESWGQKGYFQMPYDYIANARLAQDFWTIRT